MWTPEEIVTGERLQAIAEVTVATPPIVAFHRSLRHAGVREVALFPGGLDGFAPTEEAIGRLRGRRTIFVYTHLLQSFFSLVLPRLDHRFVLISHNSDASVDSRFADVLEDPRIAAWFAQNVVVDHPKLTPFPIGVANAQWLHGDVAELVAAANEARPIRREAVYCNFEISTNPEARGPLLARLRGAPRVWHAPTRPFGEYLREMASCRWCISPPGTGVDCHRTWEAIYLGTVPIVQWTAAGEALHGGLPVIELPDLAAVAGPGFEPPTITRSTDLSRLSMRHWRGLIAAAVGAVSEVTGE